MQFVNAKLAIFLFTEIGKSSTVVFHRDFPCTNNDVLSNEIIQLLFSFFEFQPRQGDLTHAYASDKVPRLFCNRVA